MDNVKDIQGSTAMKFLEQDIKTNPFGDNRSALRAYKRAERVIAAVFLLTNHIESTELLRADTRQTASSFLTQILELRDEMRSVGSLRVIRFQASIRLLISEIKILSIAGYISVQNAEIVSGAIDELGTFVQLAQKSHLSESVIISRESLVDSATSVKGHSKDIRDTIRIKDNISLRDSSSGLAKSGSRGPRGTNIMNVLKTGGELSIRDIASNLPEYGEKTIQRELVLLISEGLVAKTGSKRWSRYSLVS